MTGHPLVGVCNHTQIPRFKFMSSDDLVSLAKRISRSSVVIGKYLNCVRFVIWIPVKTNTPNFRLSNIFILNGGAYSD